MLQLLLLYCVWIFIWNSWVDCKKMLKNPSYVYGSKGLLVPGHLNFSAYILEKLWQYQDKVAMINGLTDESVTYKEIAQQAINFAVSLSRMGVGKGDVIGIFSENRQEYFSAVIGVTCTGAALTTISTGYVKDELFHALNISKPKYIICSPFTYKTHEKTLKSIKFLKAVIILGNEIPNNVLRYNDLVKVNVDFEQFEPVDVNGQTDTLFIIYSSGTTGMPKGVMLTHLNVITCCCFPLSHDPSTKTLAISPWYHAMGLVGFLIGLSSGRTGVYLPKFEIDLYLKTIEKYKIGQLTVVPPVLVVICKSTAQYDLSSVKVVLSGAAPLHKETLQAVYKKFPNVQAVMQGYGASECTLGIVQYKYTDMEVARRKPGSVGRIVMGCTIKVVDTETRKPLGPNQHGEICVRGPILMKGYVGIGRGGDFDEEGFYKTGDVGYYDNDGFFYISDRLKELIKYKGYQVPPAELEAVLLTHEAVADVGVIGVPHESGGEVPLAFVVPQKTVSEEELKQFVAERLSNPKHLRGGVRFVKQIPKTPSGKILRKDLRILAKTGKSKL